MNKALQLAFALLLIGCPSEARKPGAEPALAARDGGAQKKTAELVSHHGLAWYVDAPDAALAAAKASHKLVLVDLWAAWCHTCLSMREYVLTRAHLASVEERLVFLALDTERAENARALERLPIAAWPTFYLIDPTWKVHGRWVGAASPAQLTAFVRDGLRTYDAEQSGSLDPADPLALLIAGDRLVAEAQLTEARDHYQRALAAAPSDWARRPDALVALVGTLRKLGQVDACAQLALGSLAQTGDSASAADFAYHALGCADALAPHDARAKQLRTTAERRLAPLCAGGSARMSPDDQGDACGLLREVRAKLGDERGARAASEQRLAALSAAASGLPDAIALTYDAARAESLVALGRGDEAVVLLRGRERALPDDYNPPHLLARTYRDLGRAQDGLAAVERALAKVAGPRRIGILGLKVDLLASTGRKDEAKRLLEEQLAAYRALPKGQQQPVREQAVAQRLAAWK